MTIYNAGHSSTSNIDHQNIYNLEFKGDHLNIQSNVKLQALGEWSYVASMMTGTSLQVRQGAEALSRSTVFAGSGGLNLVEVEKGATVSGGDHAFNLNGTDNQFRNHGVIRAGYDFTDEGHAAILSGGKSLIGNSNWIGSFGNYGILLTDGQNGIMNGHMSVQPSDPVPTISGGYSALGIYGGGNFINNFGIMTAGGPTIHLMQGLEGEQNQINNTGHILSSKGRNAIQSEGEADDLVTNAATWAKSTMIKGNIMLDGGDDVLNNSDFWDPNGPTSTIIGDVRMGAGNDVVRNTGTIKGSVDLGSGDDSFDGTEGHLYSLADGRTQGPGHIYGGDGRDIITGSDVSDVIHGGRGHDVLTGGLGQDAFVFDVSLDAKQPDDITDFSVSDDMIHLESSIFRAIKGSFKADHFCVGAKAADESDRIVYNVETGALLYDADGTGSGSQAIKIAALAPHLALKAENFLLI
jgi:Ca2+-binding RTX toxin-like protein